MLLLNQKLPLFCHCFLVTVSNPDYFGHSMFNPKDIPFAFGHILAIYMTVVWLQQLPVLKWKTTLLLGLCCAAAISFRIGGILVFALTGLMVVWKYLAEKGYPQSHQCPSVQLPAAPCSCVFCRVADHGIAESVYPAGPGKPFHLRCRGGAQISAKHPVNVQG